MESAQKLGLSTLLSFALGCSPVMGTVSPSLAAQRLYERLDSKPESITICAEVRNQTEGVLTQAPILQKACDMENKMDPVEWMYLLESLRSEPAFRELAQYIEAPAHGALKVIYPGSGSHIAPVMMAAELMDAGRISEAEFTFTDISPCGMDQIGKNLKAIEKMDLGFKVQRNDSSTEQTEEAVIRHYLVDYKGKPIKIDFIFSIVEGEKWYKDQDMANSNALIIHDPGGSVPGLILDRALDYFTSYSSLQLGPSQMVMEDLTQTSKGRQVDLELIGKLERGQRGNFYGHRENQAKAFTGFSEYYACLLEQAGKASAQQIAEWKEAGTMGERTEAYTEVSYPNIHNGVVLKPHPELLNLDSGALKILMEISLAAANYNSHEMKRIGKFNKEDGEKLLSVQFYDDVFRHGPAIAEAVGKIDPKLASFLAVRFFQMLAKDKGGIFEYKNNNHPNKKAANDQMAEFLDLMEGYLESEAQNELSDSLKKVRSYVLSESGDVEAQLTGKEERQFYQFAESLLEKM